MVSCSLWSHAPYALDNKQLLTAACSVVKACQPTVNSQLMKPGSPGAAVNLLNDVDAVHVIDAEMRWHSQQMSAAARQTSNHICL